MADRSPVAFDGATLLVAEGTCVYAYDGRTDGERWRKDLREPCAGLALGGERALLLGRSGRVWIADPRSGVIRATVATGLAPATALAGDAIDRAAVLGADRIVTLRGRKLERTLTVAGARCVALGPDGLLAVGAADALYVTPEHGGVVRVPLREPAGGVAWDRTGGFVVAEGRTISRVSPHGQRVGSVGAPRWGRIEAIAVSPDGQLVASRSVAPLVLVQRLPQGDGGKAFVWVDTEPGALEFGPGHLLAVAVGGGNANLIRTGTREIRRTDPAPDRPRGHWSVELGPAEEPWPGFVDRPWFGLLVGVLAATAAWFFLRH